MTPPSLSVKKIRRPQNFILSKTRGGPDTRPVMTLMSMKSLEESLPQPGFVRVHLSFIVNMDKGRLVERNNIILAGRCIPVSDSYRHRFFEVLGGM